jgi:hypothetical protein
MPGARSRLAAQAPEGAASSPHPNGASRNHVEVLAAAASFILGHVPRNPCSWVPIHASPCIESCINPAASDPADVLRC